MNNIFLWCRKNWIIVLLISLLALTLNWKLNLGSYPMMNSYQTSTIAYPAESKMMSYDTSVSNLGMMQREVAPTTSADRIIVQDTSMSMLVKDVSLAIKGIERTISGVGGFMVNKNLNKPEGAATGSITIRVPSEKREETLDSIRSLGIKVTNENVSGNDVTDQYVDLDTRIQSLELVKAKIEKIMDQAVTAETLMSIQNQINNIQNQIDSLKGQQKYLEQTAKLSRITISLSTDELSLPYSPDTAWRPNVVFKLAVRSMLGSLRSVADFLIWTVVYLPVVLIILVIIWVLKMLKTRYSKDETSI